MGTSLKMRRKEVGADHVTVSMKLKILMNSNLVIFTLLIDISRT